MSLRDSGLAIIAHMETKLSSNVADLTDEQRRLLESLIGQPLNAEEVVYWTVMRPGRTPRPVRAGMQELFKKADQHIAKTGTSPTEIDAAVDEAVQQVRARCDT